MDASLLWQIILQVFLIALNAIFACAEIAVISVSEARLEQIKEGGDKRGSRLLSLTKNPAKFLATIQVAITLSGFLGSAFAADNFSEYLVKWVMSWGVSINEKVLDSISVIIITLILSYITLICGELVPKRLAMKNPEKIALGISGMVFTIAKIFAPIVWLLTISTNAVLRLFGVDPNADDSEVSEEEIRLMVEAGSAKGVIDTEAEEMIQNVFEFNDTAVEEFATHRTEIDLLWLEKSEEEWAETIRQTRHSRYPICSETVDNVVGILNVHEYFRLEDQSRASVMENAVTAPQFVPETMRADALFKKMKTARNHLVVVLDEYGGMSGIVTMTDLLEQIVGEFAESEDEVEVEKIVRLEDGTYRILGIATLDDVAEELDIELPTDEYDTFSGYVLGSYGDIPDDGTIFEFDTPEFLHIAVSGITDHRVDEAIVTKILPPEENEEEAKEEE